MSRPLLLLALSPLLGCAGVSPSPEQRATEIATLGSGPITDSVEAATEAARVLLAQGRYEVAAERAEAVLAEAPQAARARAVLGAAMGHLAFLEPIPPLANVERAEGELLAATRQAPRDPLVTLLRCQFLVASGHLSAAVAAAEQGLADAPTGDDRDRVALLRLAGEVAYELGEEQRAMRHLEALAVQVPDDATLFFRLGASQLRLAAASGDPNDAVAAAAAFARSAELAPGDDDVHLAVVAAHVRAFELAHRSDQVDVAQRELDAAQVTAATVAATFPRSAEAAFRLGVVAELRGDVAAAAVGYEQALAIDPEHLGALLDLAALLRGTAIERARSLWQRALDADGRRGGLEERERAELRALVGGTV